MFAHARGAGVARTARWAFVLVSVATAGAMLIQAATVGIRIPLHWRLGGLPFAASLDYSTFDASLDPLEPRFIKGVLGEVIPPSVLASAHGPGEQIRRNTSRPAEFEDLPRTSAVHALTNDDFGNARVVPSEHHTAKTNTAGATREDEEPSSCARVGGTVWYRYTPARDMGLSANTFGTGYPASLGVFEGTGLNNLEKISCDTDARGNAEAAFAARAGTTYFFQIAGTGGSLVFNLDLTGITTRASVDSAGRTGSGMPFAILPLVSADGRFVVFTITQNPPGFSWGLYLRDRATHTTTRVDVGPPGVPRDGGSWGTGLSADGRTVVFMSSASALVDGGNVCKAGARTGVSGSCWGVFVRDMTTGRIDRVSVSSSGDPANGYSLGGSVSADGRYIVFSSAASNLVRGDTNEVWDVFVHDRVTRKTTRINVPSSGKQANGDTATSPTLGVPLESGSTHLSISANGRYVAFRSTANNLVPGDTNDATDVFVRDRVTGTTTRVSVNSVGEEGNKGAGFAVHGTALTVSDDGRYVVFNSSATNLADDNNDGLYNNDDWNAAEDIFLRDIILGTTTRVSVSLSEQEAKRGGIEGTGTGSKCEVCAVTLDNGFTLDSGYLHDPYYFGYSMTPSGRYVVFASDAPNLVPGDEDPGVADVFVRDTIRGTTTRLSISSRGYAGDAPSNYPTMSADGRFVAFQSQARNLCDTGPPQCPAGGVDEPQTQPEGSFVHERPGRGGLSRMF